MAEKERRPLKVFISYSHEDEGLCQELVKHLALLQREGRIEKWYDRKITGGREWAGQIDEHLEAAHIVLLLISSVLHCLRLLLRQRDETDVERDEDGKARVIPVILRTADWQGALFGKLQAFPKNGKPIVEWEPRDRGFLDVAVGLRKVVQELSGAAAEGGAETPYVPGIARRKIPVWRLILTGVMVAALALAGVLLYRHVDHTSWEQQQLDHAQAFMNAGRYLEAKGLYEGVLKADPKSAPAQFGARKAGLPELREDPEKYGIELEDLLKQYRRGTRT